VNEKLVWFRMAIKLLSIVHPSWVIGRNGTTTAENRVLRVNNAQLDPLSVFPNPNNGDFMISFQKEKTFSLVNNLGESVQTLQLIKAIIIQQILVVWRMAFTSLR
jgi:hypothetical protein